MTTENSAALPTIEAIAAKYAANPANHAEPPAVDGPPTVTPEPQEKPTTETAVAAPEATPTPVAAPKPDPTAAKFGALARRERELRAKEKEIQDKIKEADEKSNSYRALESKAGLAKSNPLAFLKEHGLTYQDVTNAVLGGYEAPEEDPLDAKLKPHHERVGKAEEMVSKLQEKLEKLEAELASKQQRESMEEVTKHISDTLESDDYEYTRSLGEDGVDMVRDIMVEYYKAHERLLEYSEACQLAEDYIQREYVTRLSATKKFSSGRPSTAPEVKPSPIPAKKPTLTNAHASVGSEAKTVNVDEMSRDDAIDYLTKKLKFK